MNPLLVFVSFPVIAFALPLAAPVVDSTPVLAPAAIAPSGGYPWTNHARPFTFLFGNHIDTHQQTALRKNGELFGFLYIEFTGEVTQNGFPVAKHCNQNTPPRQCEAGWILRAKPGTATFVYHQKDHPIWLVDSRNDIPQPGTYSHFHWTGGPSKAKDLVPGTRHSGYFLELIAIDTFAFEHGGEKIEISRGIDMSTHVNVVASFPGY